MIEIALRDRLCAGVKLHVLERELIKKTTEQRHLPLGRHDFRIFSSEEVARVASELNSNHK